MFNEFVVIFQAVPVVLVPGARPTPSSPTTSQKSPRTSFRSWTRRIRKSQMN